MEYQIFEKDCNYFQYLFEILGVIDHCRNIVTFQKFEFLTFFSFLDLNVAYLNIWAQISVAVRESFFYKPGCFRSALM